MGEWSRIVDALASRFEVAAKFNHDAVWNSTGATAMAKLIRDMARIIDDEIVARRSQTREIGPPETFIESPTQMTSTLTEEEEALSVLCEITPLSVNSLWDDQQQRQIIRAMLAFAAQQSQAQADREAVLTEFSARMGVACDRTRSVRGRDEVAVQTSDWHALMSLSKAATPPQTEDIRP